MNSAAPNAVSLSSRPTRVRWQMMAMLTLITALTYLDRLNLGIAGHYIQSQYGLSTERMGTILSAFIWGYALFQIPGGWAGDRFGPRSVLTFAIVWWSVFTATTALAPDLPLARWFGLAGSFIVVRFLIGIGEAATLPNANKIVSFWMGDRSRGVGNSMFLMGLGLGGTVTPLFIAWMMERWGWRSSFYACAVIGIVVALGWGVYATSRPEEHPRVNSAELQLIRAHSDRPEIGAKPSGPSAGQVPWRKLLSSPSAWSLILSYFCEGYPNYIFYTWFYMYLVQVRGLTVLQGGFWGALPFLASMILAPIGGWFSDRAVLRWGKRRGRQCAVWVGMILAGILLTAGAHTQNNTAAILMLAGAMGFNIFATVTWWATSIDLAPNFSGSLSATMNTCGNIGGALSPIVTAYIATHFGWTAALDFAAVISFVAAILWLGVKADQNLETSS
jgi:ACS family glucarate transporter-like MFS transporter